jgi:hypothetical protein
MIENMMTGSMTSIRTWPQTTTEISVTAATMIGDTMIKIGSRRATIPHPQKKTEREDLSAGRAHTQVVFTHNSDGSRGALQATTTRAIRTIKKIRTTKTIRRARKASRAIAREWGAARCINAQFLYRDARAR